MIDEGNKPDFIVLVMNCQNLSYRLEGEGVFAGSGKRHADFCRGMMLKLNCRAVWYWFCSPPSWAGAEAVWQCTLKRSWIIIYINLETVRGGFKHWDTGNSDFKQSYSVSSEKQRERRGREKRRKLGKREGVKRGGISNQTHLFTQWGFSGYWVPGISWRPRA